MKAVKQGNLQNIQISSFIAISMIIIFFIFNAKIINNVPCGKGIKDVFISNFVHINFTHLLSNLHALYALSRVEEEMGFKSFMWLLIFLLIFNTLAEFALRNIWKDMKCSIGFSGILFGMMTWELIVKKKLDNELMIAIIIMIAGPSLRTKKASLSGHVIGAVSGIVGALIWKKVI